MSTASGGVRARANRALCEDPTCGFSVASFFQFCPKQAGDREACKIQARIQASARDASDLSKKTGLRPGNKATSSDLFDSVARAVLHFATKKPGAVFRPGTCIKDSWTMAF
jgi:hypothetical protein